MSDIIYLKIDVTKINNEKLFKGAKGTYLDAILIPKKTQFGDFMIVQSATKEERARGERGAILGNGKYSEVNRASPRTVSAQDSKPEESQDVPF